MWIGDVLDDRFEIVRPVGSGGMATVFRALDRTTGAEVAVKAVDVTWDGISERFRREATVLSEIVHPAVVRYVAHGEANGAPYLAMELLSGEDLEARLARKPLSVTDALALARRVAEGLSAAHAKGIVHRDIKPSNLFLVDCDPRQVKVVDFGVARLHARAQTMTRTGSMLGTIGYMAPEQATGERNVDPSADVFAIGCVLFECLTGRPAFSGAHAVTVMAKVLCEEPPRVGSIKPELSGAIDELVARLLAKDRSLRPKDGAVVAEELRTAEAHPTPRLGTRTEDARAATSRATASVILGVPETTFVESGKTMTPTQAADETGRLDELAQRHRARLTWLEGRSLVLELLDGSTAAVSERAVACALDLERLDLGLALALATAPGAAIGALIDEAFSLLGRAGSSRGAGRVIVDPATAEVARAHFDVEAKGDVSFVRSRSERSGPGDGPGGETLDVVGDDRVHGRSPMLQSFLSRSNEERKLGAFYLRRQLGRGGFAPVWLASEVYDEVELRAAAVKLFSFATAESGGRGRGRYREHVIQEARALCQVEHPSIVRFYTLLIEDDVGIVGLAMEYLGGSSLADRLRESERLSVEETVRVGVALASALDAAHRVGVVHRDVKPANVMESPNGYKLIDFGIATADELEPQNVARREARNFLPANLPLEVVGTKISVLVGTAQAPERTAGPGVMASGTMGYIDPECIASGVRATAASDLYSLGALLFECLTGQVPAIAAATRPGLHAEVLDGRTPAPKVDSLAPKVPPRLAMLVDRLLTPERSRRPATAGAVLAELEAIRDGLSRSDTVVAAESVATPSAPARGRPWLLGGGVAAALVAAFVAMRGSGSGESATPAAPRPAVVTTSIAAASPAPVPVPVDRVSGTLAVRPATATVTVDGALVRPGADGTLPLAGEPGSSFQVVVAVGTARRETRVVLLRDGHVEPDAITLSPEPATRLGEKPLVAVQSRTLPTPKSPSHKAAPTAEAAGAPTARAPVAATPFRHTRD